MDMRAVDLNLLTVLNALLDESHVSRAAARLGMSQSATSSALDRCRHLFDDLLLERAGSSMRLTSKAEALRQPLAEVMAQIAGIISIEPAPLSAIRRPVHIVMADALGTYLGPMLQEATAAAAPGIDLVLHPWSGGTAALRQLANGSVDLAVSVLPTVDRETFHVEPVCEERYVVAMRAGHPAADGFGLEQWLAWPHIIVSAEGGTRTPVDDQLAATGRVRRIGIVVPSFLLVPDLLRGSDLLALLPALVTADASGRGLVAFDPPMPINGFTLQLAWHRRRGQDRAVQYVAGEMRRFLGTANT